MEIPIDETEYKKTMVFLNLARAGFFIFKGADIDK